MNKTDNSYNEDSTPEIDLQELFMALWAAKIKIGLVTILFAVLSIVFALSKVDIYTSETILSISEESNNLTTPNQFSGLASLAGISISSQGVNKAALILETVESRHFLEHLITFEGVLPSLMAAESFDVAKKKLIYDKNIFEEETGTWLGEQAVPIPTYLEAHRAYLDSLDISLEKGSGFIKISFDHVSPIFSKEMLNLIIREINSIMRKKDLEESSAALTYLKSEISKTSLVDIRNSINLLIEGQLQTQMMARVKENYILGVIEPPYIPDLKSEPNRSSICFLGTLLGALLGVLWALFSFYFFEKRSSASSQ